MAAMILLLHLSWIILVRLCQCVDIEFDISIGSLMEFDENEESVSTNAFTEFYPNDWRNSSIFEPILSNEGSLQMTIVRIPQNNELQYTIHIIEWPWEDEHNSIQFCFDISVPNSNGLQFKSLNSVDVSIHMQQHSIHICHRFYPNQLLDIAHIYYTTDIIEQTLYYSTTLSPVDLDNNKVFTHDSNGGMTEYILWLFGVSMTILFILCLFISVVCYLCKQGFFSDTVRHRKSMIMIGKRASSTVSTPRSPISPITPMSPKKNIRINVTLHKKRNNMVVDVIETENKSENKMERDASLNRHNRVPTPTKTATVTAETMIMKTLVEGDEDEESEFGSDSLEAITPMDHGDGGSVPRDSLIQYIISCASQSLNENGNDQSMPTSPIPFL